MISKREPLLETSTDRWNECVTTVSGVLSCSGDRVIAQIGMQLAEDNSLIYFVSDVTRDSNNAANF